MSGKYEDIYLTSAEASNWTDDGLYSAKQTCRISAEEDIEMDSDWCPRVWDDIHCWPPTRAGEMVMESCSTVLPVPTGQEKYSEAVAFRFCNESAMWHLNWTNYSQCLDVLSALEQQQSSAVVAVNYITFTLGMTSLIALIVSLGIFAYFSSLECDRLRVHRNLLVSLTLHCLAMIIFVEPYITNRTSLTYRDKDWLCRSLLTLQFFGQVASIMWMFVEGLFLHSRLTCNVFDSSAPFKLYYCIGWGLPAVVLLSWCLVMHFLHPVHCWGDYSRVQYLWILEVPMMTALLINLLFLINIIKILVTKLRTNNSVETIRIRKTVRATLILFQILGITNLLFAYKPSQELEAVYMVTNAILQSSQGLIVSTMYCFWNTEVREVVRKRWRQYCVRKMNVDRPNNRQGSFYSHRKGTYSTIVLPVAFSSTRRNKTTLQPPTNSTLNSTNRRKVDFNSELSTKTDYCEIQIVNSTKGDPKNDLFTCQHYKDEQLVPQEGGFPLVDDTVEAVSSCSPNCVQTICSNQLCAAVPCNYKYCVYRDICDLYCVKNSKPNIRKYLSKDNLTTEKNLQRNKKRRFST